MKTKLMVMTAVATLVGLSATVQATPVTGVVNFGGSVTLATSGGVVVSTVAAAQEVKSWANTATALSSGDLAAAYGTSVTFTQPWAFGVQANLWTYTASDGDVFTFNLTSISSDVVSGLPGNQQLAISGIGTIHEVSGLVTLSDTTGTWGFTTQEGQVGGQFTFSAGTTVPTPDGGMTVILLGAALSGLGLLRKKLIA